MNLFLFISTFILFLIGFSVGWLFWSVVCPMDGGRE